MAGEYKNSISLGIKLKPTNEVQTELNTVIKQLNENSSIKLNIDTTTINQSLNDFSTTLMVVGEQLKSHFNMHGVSDEIDMLQKKIIKVKGSSLDVGDGSKGFDELQARAKAIRETVDELAKISFNTTKNGAVKDASITYTDNMGKLVTETMKWKNVSGDAENEVKRVFTTTNIAISDNIKTLENYNQKLEATKSKMQSSVNTLSSNSKNSNNLNGFIDESVIKNIQNKLNSINTNSSEKEIKELQNAIKNLSSSEPQIVRVQNAILKLENGLTAMKGKYGNLVGDSSSKESLANYIAQIENLKKVLSSLNNGESFNPAKLSQELGKGTNASRELSTAVKNSSSAFKLATNDASSFSNVIKRTFENAGLYLGTYQIIQQITDQFKKAGEYALMLDKNISDIQIITGRTRDDVVKVTNSFKDLGEQLHTTNADMLSSASEMMRAGYSDEDSKKMIEQSVIGAKISGQTTEDVSQQLITMKNAFNMSADSMSHVIDIFSKLDNTSATSFKEIAEAVSRTAFSAQEAKVPLDTLASYITVVSEKTRREASTIGDQFRTMFSRFQNIKLGIYKICPP